MAYTQAASALTEQHRLAQVGIAKDVLARLLALWPLLLAESGEERSVRWLELSLTAVRLGIVESVEVAKRYYEAFRLAETGRMIPPALTDLPAPENMARVAAGLEAAGPGTLSKGYWSDVFRDPSGYKGGTFLGVSDNGGASSGHPSGEWTRVGTFESAQTVNGRYMPAFGPPLKVPGGGVDIERQKVERAALTKVLGVAQRETLQPARELLAETVVRDPAAIGYARVVSGNACAFCIMLASRGPVYGKKSGDFEAHRGCACTVEPEFDVAGQYSLPPGTFQAANQWADFLQDRKDNPERYEGLSGTKQQGPNKGQERSSEDKWLLAFRRFVEQRNPVNEKASAT